MKVLDTDLPEVKIIEPLVHEDTRGFFYESFNLRDYEAALGPLEEGRKYCLKIPSALGGHYGCDNLAMAPLAELIRFSGEGAQQYEGLPRWN